MPAPAGFRARPGHRRRGRGERRRRNRQRRDGRPAAHRRATPTCRRSSRAPLKVGERVIGVIALGSTMPMAYTAARAEAAEHAGAADGDGDRKRAAVRASDRRRRTSASGCWRCNKAAEVARAKLESELDARGADPGRSVSRRCCRRSPATRSPRATGPPGGAAATTTTR